MQKPNPLIIKRLVIWLWSLYLAVLILSIFCIFMIRINFMDLSGGFPSYRSLENPKNELSSLLFSADNVILGSYFTKNRSQASFDELSPELINTLISTEDVRFNKHPGISLRDLARVFIKTIILRQQVSGGGSTITQQLAKNLFRTRTDLNIGKLNDVPVLGTVIFKIKEMILAVELEKNFTKNEILAMFLNTIQFGGNTFGIKVASTTFFNKDPIELNYQEAAVMTAMVNRPTRYNPHSNPDEALAKRNQILKKIVNYDVITKHESDSLCTLPIDLDYKADTHLEGLATYFRSYIRDYLMQWCRENGYDLFEDGLRIYTTIDSRMQAYGEKALLDHMKVLQAQFYEQWEGKNPWVDDGGVELKDYIDLVIKRTDHYKELVAQYGASSDSIRIILNKPVNMRIFTWDGEKDTIMSPIDSLKYFKKFLQAGFMSMDPRNGQIKAWVGGIDYRYFKYDHVKQSTRQPGSVFKPIVYTAVIASGYSPCYEVIDAPVTFSVEGQIPPSWTPPNANGIYTGERMTIRDAMARSVNSITAYMIKEINPSNVVLFGKRLGIESRLDPVPSLCLGTSDVSLYELCGAYSTFVNEGVYILPYFITRIEDKNGKILQEFPPRTREAISEETAYVMLHMLKGATEVSGGTAQRLSMDIRENNEIGAKTGTTNNASDGWFMGITHNLVSGVWVGGDDRSIHFKSWAVGQGGRTALPIWENYMRDVYNDPELGFEKGSFKQPRRKLSIELDCNKYKNMIQDSPDSLDIYVAPIDVDVEDIM